MALVRRNALKAGMAAVSMTAILLLSACALGPTAEELEDRAETQSDIEDFVAELKAEVDLPYQVDSVTTLDEVEAKEMKIRNLYTVSDQEWTEDFEPIMKVKVTEVICANAKLKDFSDRGVSFTYEYNFVDSKKVSGVNITKPNCS